MEGPKIVGAHTGNCPDFDLCLLLIIHKTTQNEGNKGPDDR